MSPITTAAERSILGALLDSPQFVADVINLGLEPEDFSYSGYADLWNSLRKLHLEGQPVSIVAVWDRMGGRQDTAEIMADLIFGAVATKARVESLTKLVLKYSRVRACSRLGSWLQQQAGETGADPLQIVAMAAKELKSMAAAGGAN
jgi:replicative DNA helicase